MTPEQFAARRQAGWAELERHVAQARRGALRSVPAADLQRFGVLYRHAASDLAIARRDFPDQPVTEYLNGLCGRAHPLLYRGQPVRPSALPRFYASVLPRTVRAAGPYIAASLALSLAGVLAGWLAVRLRPDLAATLIPDSLFDRMARGEVSGGIGDAPVAASLIIGNNVKVALLCFCGGVLVGIPTALTLLANGWVLGTLASSIHRDGIDYRFWAYIVPHGVIELSVIVLAGATGLMVGDAILRPGLLSRGDALVAVALRAVTLCVGVASLLVVAGLLEGFVSPSDLPAPAKYAIGAGSAVLLYSWLLLGGRTRRDRPAGLQLDGPPRGAETALEIADLLTR
jgi:uncharacterized membrane protein SpoIIM required for sporulation